MFTTLLLTLFVCPLSCSYLRYFYNLSGVHLFGRHTPSISHLTPDNLCQKQSAALKVPQSSVASIILQCKKSGTTKTLRSTAKPNSAITQEEPLRETKPRTQWPPWLSSIDPLWRREKLPERQPSEQQSTYLSLMADWPEGSFSSVKDLWKLLGVCTNAPKGDSDCEKQDSLVWWNLNWLFDLSSRYHIWRKPGTTVTCRKSSLQWSIVVAASFCVGVFWDKTAPSTVQKYPLVKIWSRVLRTLDWTRGSLLNKTMTLNSATTSQEWQGTTLSMSLSGPARAPIQPDRAWKDLQRIMAENPQNPGLQSLSCCTQEDSKH